MINRRAYMEDFEKSVAKKWEILIGDGMFSIKENLEYTNPVVERMFQGFVLGVDCERLNRNQRIKEGRFLKQWKL